MLYITLVIMLVYLRSHSKQFQILKKFPGEGPQDPLVLFELLLYYKISLVGVYVSIGQNRRGRDSDIYM